LDVGGHFQAAGKVNFVPRAPGARKEEGRKLTSDAAVVDVGKVDP
jgi:hypothetical protein